MNVLTFLTFLTFLTSTLLLAAFVLLVFFANQPEHKVYPGNHQEVCSTNLSADDYQTCQVIISEGGEY